MAVAIMMYPLTLEAIEIVILTKLPGKMFLFMEVTPVVEGLNYNLVVYSLDKKSALATKKNKYDNFFSQEYKILALLLQMLS